MRLSKLPARHANQGMMKMKATEEKWKESNSVQEWKIKLIIKRKLKSHFLAFPCVLTIGVNISLD